MEKTQSGQVARLEWMVKHFRERADRSGKPMNRIRHIARMNAAKAKLMALKLQE